MFGENITAQNGTLSGCDINLDAFNDYILYTAIVCSIAAFTGNILVILTVYRTKTLRTTPNYFIVNMAVSDVLFPALDLLWTVLFYRRDAGNLSQTLGTSLCKIISFFGHVSYGVSMSSLVVIAVHRFYAVTFPMKARLDRVRTRVVLLVCTWLVPIGVYCPLLYFRTFHSESQSCYDNMTKHQRLVYKVITATLSTALPLVIMLVLYPVIIVKLIRQKVPGNSSSSQVARRRRNQNICLTKMFLTIVVTFILSWGTYQVVYLVDNFEGSNVPDPCILNKISLIVDIFPDIFHAINPAIYFIFCSSYLQGIKQVFSCCCRPSADGHNAPGGEPIPLEHVQHA